MGKARDVDFQHSLSCTRVSRACIMQVQAEEEKSSAVRSELCSLTGAGDRQGETGEDWNRQGYTRDHQENEDLTVSLLASSRPSS